MTDSLSDDDVLGELLAAEHAAVYAYAVLGAHLDQHLRAVALSAYDAHRASRDGLLDRMRARHLATPGPSLSYAVAVTNPRSAVLQAVSLEEGLSVRWRDLVSATDAADLRRLAVTSLSAAAVRATRWRQLAGVQPLTDPFPGQA